MGFSGDLFFFFFAMGFDFGKGIDCGGVVMGNGNFFFGGGGGGGLILGVANWCLWLSFGGNWKMVVWDYWRER